MLIAILILLCLLILMNIFNYGGLVLIRKEISTRKRDLLPQVKPGVLRTLAGELDRVSKSGRESEEGQRWTDEFFSEQPSLAHFLHITSQREDQPAIVPAIVMYKLLKAQAEADSLADLTKIQR